MFTHDELYKIYKNVGSDEYSENLIKVLLNVRNSNRDMFKKIDPEAEETINFWEKDGVIGPKNPKGLLGGGMMTVFRGEALEKAAVNISFVKGQNYPQEKIENSNTPFIAAGVSLIAHPKNPFAPIAHMNIRYIKLKNGSNSKQWIGGGADLTPLIKFEEDNQEFFSALKEACEFHPSADFENFKKWCDDYFFIKHRNRIRGVGGIFFDDFHINEQWEFNFLEKIGNNFMKVYKNILSRRIDMPYDEEDRNQQLMWRGQYVEFNLLYDRGTRFGLLSGGNPEAIFCSLPPLVRW